LQLLAQLQNARPQHGVALPKKNTVLINLLRRIIFAFLCHGHIRFPSLLFEELYVDANHILTINKLLLYFGENIQFFSRPRSIAVIQRPAGSYADPPHPRRSEYRETSFAFSFPGSGIDMPLRTATAMLDVQSDAGSAG
jgi:hypothetical protein